MLQKNIEIDLNAHVEDISVKIFAQEEKAIANILFFNNTGKTITDIKFKAYGYNAFGDAILVDGKESFLITIQDISVEPYKDSAEMKWILPENTIRKLKLVEEQIRYSDGHISNYEGANIHIFEVTEYDDSDQRKVDLLEGLFGTKFLFVPQMYDEGWLCGCGQFNNQSISVCPCCKCKKDQILQVGNKDFVDETIKAKEEYDKKIEKGKRKRKWIIFFSCLFTLLFLVGGYFYVAHNKEMGRRKLFNSVETLKTNLKGTWSYYSSIIGETIYYVISDNELDIVSTPKNSSEPIVGQCKITEWKPEQGCITVINGDGKEFFVALEKSGNSIYNSSNIEFTRSFADPYSKHTTNQTTSNKTNSNKSKSSNYTRTTATPQESGEKVLKFSNLRYTRNSSYVIIEGSITNNGNLTYDFVKVKGLLLDEDGKVIDTEWTYAVGGEHLRPGESTTFTMYAKDNSKIKKVRVELLDYKISDD